MKTYEVIQTFELVNKMTVEGRLWWNELQNKLAMGRRGSGLDCD